jgi:hydrogenase expression/formation protein HypE
MTGSGKDRIVLAHGGGGEMTRRLLEERILPKLKNDLLDPLFDSAVLPAMKGRLCLTTDAFVVQPLEFPGGDIGRLAVCGTVNDLAVMGARPVALSLALVIEEGLFFEQLDRIVASIESAAREAGVPIATGDTKVVERGRGDGLTITTAGVGELPEGIELEPGRIEAGDGILVSGRIAEHGLSVMAAREELNIDTKIRSDAAPLTDLIATLLDAGGDVKFVRDPTRGGVAGVLADLVEDTGLGLQVEEERLPLSAVCRHTCELLGLDPLTVANEGKIVAVVDEKDIEKALEALRGHPLGKDAKCVGRMLAEDLPLAELVTAIGGRRIVQRPYGEELPRIC